MRTHLPNCNLPLLLCLRVRMYPASGTGAITWDGTFADGKPVANGVYVYKLDVEGYRVAKKMSIKR